MQTLNDSLATPLPAPAPAHSIATMVKDGWLFIGIGHLSLIAGIMAWVVSSNGMIYEKDPGSVGLVVSATVWAVLCCAGLFKLSKARQAGELSWKIRVVLLAAWLVAGFFGHALVDLARLWPYDTLCYALVFAASMAIGIRSACRQPECKKHVEQRGLLLALLGVLTVAYGLGFYEQNYRRDSDFFRSTFAPVFSYACGVLWIVLCLAGARALTAARHAGVANAWTRWGTRLLFLHIIVFADLVLAHARIHQSYQHLLIVAVTLGGAAIAVGMALASFRQKTPSRWRRTLFCAPFLFFAVGVVAPAVGILSDCRYSPYSESADAGDGVYSCVWAWPMTEAFVLPVAQQFAVHSRRQERLYRWGFIPLDVLKGHATGSTRLPTNVSLQIESLYGWMRRDRQGAMEYALTVGLLSQPRLNPSLSSVAGGFIGLHGSNAQIIERLSGNYDRALKERILYALQHQKRSAQLLAEISKLKDQTPAAWYALSSHPDILTGLWKNYMENPTAAETRVLNTICLHTYLWNKIDFQTIKTGLQSEDSDIRKIALSYHDQMYTLTKDEWQRVVAAAKGETPNCDTAEQRRANALLKACLLPQRTWQNLSIIMKAGVTPLTPAELGDIVTTCTQAEQALSKK